MSLTKINLTQNRFEQFGFCRESILIQGVLSVYLCGDMVLFYRNGLYVCAGILG
ncbi:MAG: hypothetical protein U0T81_06445 [Saprospiraceae bacterium]